MAEDASENRGPVAGEILPAPRHIPRFALAVLGWSFVSFPLWFLASAPISFATAWVAARAIEVAGPVEAVHFMLQGQRVVFEAQPDASKRYLDHLPAGSSFEIGVDPRKQTVCLAFFLALLGAARPRSWGRAAAGWVALIVLAGLAVACEAALGYATVAAASGARFFRPGAVAASGLALGYQVGTLLIPTLAPIALWFWARSGASSSPRGPESSTQP